jgi:hypothetical protein
MQYVALYTNGYYFSVLYLFKSGATASSNALYTRVAQRDINLNTALKVVVINNISHPYTLSLPIAL